MSDSRIRVGRVLVIFVGAVMAAISYSHIRDLALGYGGDSLTAPLLPLGIDGAVAAMTVFMHQASGAALWLSRFGLVAAIGMTVACNTAYGAAYGVGGALLWSSPALLFVICVEVSVLAVRARPEAVRKPSAAPAREPSAQPSAEPLQTPSAARKRKAPRKPSDADRVARLRALLDGGETVSIDRAMAELKAGRPVAKRALALAMNGSREARR